ncbi:aminodeoxychorismate/anthranilate synthase component II [Limibacter armeniacum]|uniref:anthranilate synthase component II n=1 Tax=Limibacter armeniacum TaxID=466084 RepID=UPI002FE4FC9E
MILLLDNFDSFTYNLADYFAQAGEKCHVVRNNTPIKDIICNQYDAVVLSPGPESPQKAGNLMQVLEYYHDKLPVLGICLGHQAIGEFFGASLVKAERPMHGKISFISQMNNDPLFKDLPEKFKIVRYHSLLLEDVKAPLSVTATTDKEEVMAITHQSLPIKGVQFHPEAILTEFGQFIIRNWIITWKGKKS